ncbi:DNA primase [Candidatus Marinamargulisbacteria bacterium]|nr:DNA primase [bacterium]MDA7563959.1 DNA primase [Candidatus Marinamargulisbacteria bacterium]
MPTPCHPPMMDNQRLSDTTVETVKRSVQIVPIIQSYIQLKKRGKNYVGLCPFHGEKTPSFTVNADKNMYYCFGCHKAGDAIGFVRDMEHIGFVDAIVHIANQMGLPIEYETLSTADKVQLDRYASVYKALDLFRLSCQDALKSDTEAQAYLKSRGIAPAVLDQFGIGVVPQASLQSIVGGGISESTLVDAGLALRTESGALAPRFRQRIVFPILDHRGRTVGFGGRLYRTDSGPKYLNSPETLVFNKNRLLYAGYQSKAAIKKIQSCILVEGYIDVLVAHTHGLCHTIATMGTALSDAHIDGLKESTVILAMDSDAAGQAAMTKSSQALDRANVPVQLVDLQGLDPADFLEKHGPDLFSNQVAQALNPVEFRLKQLMRGELKNGQEKRAIVESIAPFIQRQTDPIVRQHYIQQVAKATQIAPTIIQDKIQLMSVNPTMKKRSAARPTLVSRYTKAEVMIVCAMFLDEACRTRAVNEIQLAMLHDEKNQAIFKVLATAAGGLSLADMPDTIRADIAKAMMEYDATAVADFEACLGVLHDRHTQQRIQIIKANIREKEAQGDDAAISSLLNELNQLLNL